MAGLDAKQVSIAQWLGVGAGVLAFINLFLPWVTASAVVGGESESGNSFDANVWAWLAMLLLVAAAVVAILPMFGKSVPGVAWLGLAGASLLLVIIAWLALPGVEDVLQDAQEAVGAPVTELTEAQLAQADAMMDIGPGFGLFLGLILAIVSLAGAVMARKPAGAPRAV